MNSYSSPEFRDEWESLMWVKAGGNLHKLTLTRQLRVYTKHLHRLSASQKRKDTKKEISKLKYQIKNHKALFPDEYI